MDIGYRYWILMITARLKISHGVCANPIDTIICTYTVTVVGKQSADWCRPPEAFSVYWQTGGFTNCPSHPACGTVHKVMSSSFTDLYKAFLSHMLTSTTEYTPLTVTQLTMTSTAVLSPVNHTLQVGSTRRQTSDDQCRVKTILGIWTLNDTNYLYGDHDNKYEYDIYKYCHQTLAQCLAAQLNVYAYNAQSELSSPLSAQHTAGLLPQVLTCG